MFDGEWLGHFEWTKFNSHINRIAFSNIVGGI